MDYTKTYVMVNSQEEIDKAIDFYKSKGFEKNPVTNSRKYDKDYKYVYIDQPTTYHYGDISYSNNTIDITEEVLGGKKPIEIPENTAVKVESKEEFDMLMEAYERMGWKWYGGDNPKEYSILSKLPCFIDLKDDFYWFYLNELKTEIPISLEKALEILGMEDLKTKKEKLRGMSPERIIIDEFKYEILKTQDSYIMNTFIPSQPKKMTNIIDTELFERFLKSKKTQVLDSIEKAEENIEEYENTIKPIKDFFYMCDRTKEYLKNAYNSQDKKLINKYLKELKDMNKTLEDELFTKQLFPIIKSINKFLSKKDK